MAKRSKKSGTANRGNPQQGAPAGALDDKIARLKALRLARDAGAPAPGDTFKRAPRRASNPGKTVVLSSDLVERYETLAEDRDRRQHAYDGHLPPDRAR
jgi:hypothetical protein